MDVIFPYEDLDNELITLPTDYTVLTSNQRRLVREEYSQLQQNLCYHCKSPLNAQPPIEILSKSIDESLFPENFFKWPIHLHHDHGTKMTIGTVHCYCNAVLWQYYGE